MSPISYEWSTSHRFGCVDGYTDPNDERTDGYFYEIRNYDANGTWIHDDDAYIAADASDGYNQCSTTVYTTDSVSHYITLEKFTCYRLHCDQACYFGFFTKAGGWSAGANDAVLLADTIEYYTTDDKHIYLHYKQVSSSGTLRVHKMNSVRSWI